MDVYIGLEGYTLPCRYIVKEMSVIFPNAEYSHYIFEKPNDIVLTAQDQTTIRYATRNLNSLNYADGDVPYNQLGVIFSKLDDFVIYTYSIIASKLIQSYLPTTVVINTQDLGHKLPKELPDPNCFRLHQNYRYCAKAKAAEVKDFVENGQNSESAAVQCARL